MVHVGGVDAEVGNERRGDGAEGDLESAPEIGGPGLHIDDGGGGVLAVGEVGDWIDEDEGRPLAAAAVTRTEVAAGFSRKTVRFYFETEMRFFILDRFIFSRFS